MTSPPVRVERGVYVRVNQGRTEYGSRCDELDGRTVWVWGFPTSVKARHSYQERRQKVRHAKLSAGETLPTRATISELVAVYLPTIEGKRVSAQDIARHLAWWEAYFKQQPVLTITSVQVERGLAQLRKEGRGPSTANRYGASLRRLMTKLVAPVSWVQELWRRVEWFDEPERVPIILTPAQEARLYAALPAQDALYTRLAVLLGLRMGQFFALRWEWLSWESSFVRLPSFKRHPARTLPVPSEALAILSVLWVQQGKPETGWIFPVWKQTFIGGGKGIWRPGPKILDSTTHLNARNWYARIYLPAVHAAQLPQGVVFHTLRKTWASRLGAHAPARILQLLGGWSDAKVVERYCVPYEAALRQAMEAGAGQKVSEKVSALLDGSTPKLLESPHQ